jgi:SAM-dependent methyltransferase
VPAVEDAVHLNRARAESFGAIAADYDRFRPGYPDALIDDLIALHPRSVLDIGCGTGKAARLLTTRGLPVLGVEVDRQMAAVARTHEIDVEIGSFETWNDAGRRFDLIISAQAWHWVDPQIGAPKAARLLTAGGTVALFWNFDELDGNTRAVVDPVYADLAPELRRAGPNKPSARLAELRATGAFSSVETKIYRWQRTLPTDDWIGVLGTQSDHLLLGPERLTALQAALRRALARADRSIRLIGGTYTIWAWP